MRRTQDAACPPTVPFAGRVYADSRGVQLTREIGLTSPLPPRSALQDDEFEERFSIHRVRLRYVTPVFGPGAFDTSRSSRLAAHEPA